MVNRPEMYASHGVMNLDLLDHLLVYAARKKAMIKRNRIKIYTRSYRKYDKHRYYEDTCNIDWSPVLNESNVEIALGKFYQIFTRVIDKHAHCKHINCREISS